MVKYIEFSLKCRACTEGGIKMSYLRIFNSEEDD